MGSRRQHSKGGFRRKEPAKPPRNDSAREFLNSILGSVQDGSWQPDAGLTVKEFLEDWLAAQKMRELRPSTLTQYDLVVRSYLVPAIGGLRISAVSVKDVQRVAAGCAIAA